MVGYIADADQYTLDYTSFIPYLTQVIQSQDQELQDQKEMILNQEETISEQKSQIEDLAERLADMEEILSGLLSQNRPEKAPVRQRPETGEAVSLDISAAVSMDGAARLYQNLPNPFSESTVIWYGLSEPVKSAKMVIHTVDGRLVRTYSLSRNAGSGQLTVDAGTLKPGTYTYSLVLDGRIVDAKRMIITE